MPPVRTATIAKPQQRTERTHQENQERAYIAASRRSDRSLEARVESARRASEIHKKRTGRSLRVREEDVLNEEMYEEEDDDLPSQFRRINALNPGFGSFNDRLNSYMAGHIGIRSALQQAIIQANQYQQKNNQLMSPSMQSDGLQHDIFSPQGMNSGSFNPLTPPTETMNGGRTGPHNRSASIATPQELSITGHQPTAHERRTSLPDRHWTPQDLNSPSGMQPPSAPRSHPTTPNGEYESRKESFHSPHKQQLPSGKRQKTSHGHSTTGHPYGQYPQSQIAPLTTQISLETQQLLGDSRGFPPNFFSNQPLSNVAMPSMGSYNYDSNGKPGTNLNFSHPSNFAQGLDQTLSSSAWDQSNDHFSRFSDLTSGVGFNGDPFQGLGVIPNADYDFHFDHADFGSGGGSSAGGDVQNSGNVTPAAINGEPAWNPDDFFNFGEAFV